jgi:large subunit ribosomal protein L7/L12
VATKLTTEDWIAELKEISVLELSERIKALEEEFGVSATAVAAAAPAPRGGGGAVAMTPATKNPAPLTSCSPRPVRRRFR